jgi:hypothetical protein
MPAERVAMRHAREIIRLKFSACVPTREIARSRVDRSEGAEVFREGGAGSGLYRPT